MILVLVLVPAHVLALLLVLLVPVLVVLLNRAGTGEAAAAQCAWGSAVIGCRSRPAHDALGSSSVDICRPEAARRPGL